MLISSLGKLLFVLLYAYLFVFIFGVLISWVNPSRSNPIVQFIDRATYPVMAWTRRHFPLRFGWVDFSPIVVISGIYFLIYAVAQSMIDMGGIIPNTLSGLNMALQIPLTLVLYLVIIAAVLSWISPDPYNPIVRFIYSATDPINRWIRKSFPFPLNFGGIDFTPMLVIALVVGAKAGLTMLINIAAQTLRAAGIWF